MKKRLTLILLCSCLSISVAQYKYPKLKKYIEIFETNKRESISKIESLNKNGQNLTKIDRHILALRKHLEALEKKEFLEIIESRTLAYEEDLYSPIEYLMQYDQEIANNKAIDSIRIGIFEGILKTHLETLYTKPISDLILSPVVIKVHILLIEQEPYKVDADLSVPQTILTAKVEDILKGSNSINIGSTIEFYYINNWITDGSHFLQDQIYFISLIPVIDNLYGIKRLALNVNGDNSGIIKIEENIVSDDGNLFGMGKIPWENFKKYIYSRIKLKSLKGE